MANVDTHKFEEDIKKGARQGSNDPPRSIRAKDLDDNFLKVCIVEDSARSDQPYKVNYTKDGIVLDIFPNIPQTGTHVLGAIDGKVRWIATQDCDDPAA
jgi:hypothetical protein